MTPRNEQLQEKANFFDKTGIIRQENNKTFAYLKEFRQKFPFTESLREIEILNPDKLFKINPDGMGEFFQILEDIVKSLKYSILDDSNIYRNAHLQINDFKLLLRTTVDDRKTLSQKIDARWEKIGGIGPDKEIALKIIYSFNYENKAILPIFNIQHLRYFINRISDILNKTAKYFSTGQEYEHLTLELIKNKNNIPTTRNWDNLYFTRFLYETYPPLPIQNKEQKQIETANQVTDEQLDMQNFVKLLGDLQNQQKITGEEFREQRTTWLQLKPNDRELLTIRLKQRLNNQTTTTGNTPKKQSLLTRRKL
jgi:hypothetical protein